MGIYYDRDFSLARTMDLEAMAFGLYRNYPTHYMDLDTLTDDEKEALTSYAL